MISSWIITKTELRIEKKAIPIYEKWNPRIMQMWELPTARSSGFKKTSMRSAGLIGKVSSVK
jgi:hypothetical protein